MNSGPWVAILEELGADCEVGRFLVYDEADLRCEAYRRFRQHLGEAKGMVVTAEARCEPIGKLRCDLAVWKAWSRGETQATLNLRTRPCEVVVEFKVWNDAPTKLVSSVRGDVDRLRGFDLAAGRVMFVLLGREFRDHEDVRTTLLQLGGGAVQVIVANAFAAVPDDEA